MTPNIQFTKNFSLYELLESQQARRFSFTEQFEPPDSVIQNLEALCINVLQPIRNSINFPIHVSSGYRCPRANSSIGGAQYSQHITGNAADISCLLLGNENLLKKIATMNFPFDQVINEFNYAWVHVSYNPARNRKQILEAYKDEQYETKYRPISV
jgi:zinc D-Ala-D-Ala carboxypeptidase